MADLYLLSTGHPDYRMLTDANPKVEVVSIFLCLARRESICHRSFARSLASGGTNVAVVVVSCLPVLSISHLWYRRYFSTTVNFFHLEKHVPGLACLATINDQM